MLNQQPVAHVGEGGFGRCRSRTGGVHTVRLHLVQLDRGTVDGPEFHASEGTGLPAVHRRHRRRPMRHALSGRRQDADREIKGMPHPVSFTYRSEYDGFHEEYRLEHSDFHDKTDQTLDHSADYVDEKEEQLQRLTQCGSRK